MNTPGTFHPSKLREFYEYRYIMCSLAHVKMANNQDSTLHWSVVTIELSHEVRSESDITPYIKIDKPLVVYIFT